LAGGAGIALATAGGGPSLEAAGYTEAEYAASGTATSYTSAVDPLPTDGSFELEAGPEAEFTTRVIVRRPADAGRFNGTVVVEWMNVSAGADSAPDYTYLADELLREGYAWVGVSAQHVGIEGGDIAVSVPNAEGFGLGNGLKKNDPERYGSLHHPGDAFAYDVFTQVARALRSPGPLDPLSGLEVQQVLAVGESQSAFTLTTYVNGVQPLTQAFDGFLIHSRGGATASLGQPGTGLAIADTIFGEPTTIRTDGTAPIIVVQTETDVAGVLRYLPARQPDAERFRLWEIAGTAHADRFQIGDREETLGCPTLINRGQQVFVLRAALRHLRDWAKGGAAPATAERLEVDEDLTVVVDELGNARGGVRTPVVDVPVDVLTGFAPPDAPLIALLSGTTVPLTAEQLAGLYRSRDDYLARYEAATDAAIDAGFLLADDRDQLLEWAAPERIAET
jgi:hypothetical protein